ncbi:MAG: ATP-grasp domain-containing protein [Candidatus Aenigmarchaeota archaeon]|nr:ATP-grasp domain-containing protein [Candidatus Aenigmarchaeota archaeon]
MEIASFSDVNKVFAKFDGTVIGVGVNAFNRIGPEKFLSNYRILSLSHNRTSVLIEKDIRTFSIEKRLGKQYTKSRNPHSMLKEEMVREFLSTFRDTYLLFYQITSPVEQICRENGWNIIGIPQKQTAIRKKTEFRKVAKKLGIAVIPGEVLHSSELDYKRLRKKYGTFVLQLPGKDGGRGTFLIESEKNLENIDGEVVITKFISGTSPSVTGCVTRHGILCSEARNQITDAEGCIRENAFGVFCGHDWSAPVPEKVRKKSREYTEKIGNYLKKSGYKGIFGLDMVFDGKELYAVECNPRLLGTFPVYSMLQLMRKEPSLMAFHMLEFIGMDYEIDLEKLNSMLQEKKKGSHVMLCNISGETVTNHKSLKAGVYIHDKGLKYLRSGYQLEDLRSEREFVLTDSVPFKGYVFKPNQRILKMLSLSGMTVNNRLSQRFIEIIRAVYKSLDLRPV